MICTESVIFSRFRSIAKSYFRRADGVLLLYDVTYERSFLSVREWMETIEVRILLVIVYWRRKQQCIFSNEARLWWKGYAIIRRLKTSVCDSTEVSTSSSLKCFVMQRMFQWMFTTVNCLWTSYHFRVKQVADRAQQAVDDVIILVHVQRLGNYYFTVKCSSVIPHIMILRMSNKAASVCTLF